MSLSIQQIIADARRLADRLKERENTVDVLLNDAQSAIKKAHELKQVWKLTQYNNLTLCHVFLLSSQYEDEVEQLNETAHQKPHSELIANIQKENRHLREIQQENKELKASLEDHQIALEHIMSKYRLHTSDQIYKTRLNFVKYENKRYNEIIKQQAEKIQEMAAVMDKAAIIDESRANTEEEIIARLRLENKVNMPTFLKALNQNPATQVIINDVSTTLFYFYFFFFQINCKIDIQNLH